MDKQELVVMSKGELEELIERVTAKTAKKANQNLYDGITKAILFPMERDIRIIMDELDALRRGEY
ncbi:hypothetical protein QT711_03190 [Sporosarcina saromensis]|uniref:Uncharacterized protein n=1 Tax=Sporosarcina saromensis TaxID=359365 RepID=A0ABU4G5C4_9BACL|nr:hypothetical protein [Sporosarcina saromensis]MDW0112175.1 hypothetical protein [Sporosarcina saromensis]